MEAFVSLQEPKNIKDALKDPGWVKAMQEEIEEFERNHVWKLVPRPKEGKSNIVTRWLFRNKKDDKWIVIHNKAMLVAQGYNQQEGIDYNETYALVARLEAIRLFLAFASHKGFKVYQLDVKSAFLYEKVQELVYVSQPPGFTDPEYLDRVYKLDKALYGLHQAPRAWYETLSSYLLNNGFERGKIDSTLFIRRKGENFLLVQVYVESAQAQARLCHRNQSPIPYPTRHLSRNLP